MKTKAYQEALTLALREELKRRMIDSLACFAREAWHVIEPNRPYVNGWHIRAICEHLEACVRGEIRDLVINIPPRHMKSLLVCVLFPAWVWIRSGERRWLFSSYSDTLSRRDSIKCRRLIESAWYQDTFKPTWKLADDQNQAKRFANNIEGIRIATSVGGSGTGEGGDFIVVDDPHKAHEIHSDVKREGVLDWWDNSMSTRGNDPKTFCKIIVMQRLHQQDLTGHVLNRGGYTHLVLPAEYEGNKNMTSLGWEDPRDTPGQLLWPARFGQTEIDKLKSELGSLGSAGQLQQHPASLSGNIFRRDWWKFYREQPARFDQIIQSWDFAVKDKEGTDYTVGITMGRIGSSKYLLDVVRGRMSFPAACQAVVHARMKWRNCHKTLIEDKANGPAVIDTLKKQVSGLIPVEPIGDKVQRANAVSPDVEAGNVYLPDPQLCSWVGDFITELADFPTTRFDDQVDAFSQALFELRKAHRIHAPIMGYDNAIYQ